MSCPPVTGYLESRKRREQMHLQTRGLALLGEDRLQGRPPGFLTVSHECQEKLRRGGSGPMGRATAGSRCLRIPSVCVGFEVLGVGDRPDWQWGDRTRPALTGHLLTPWILYFPSAKGLRLAQARACRMTLGPVSAPVPVPSSVNWAGRSPVGCLRRRDEITPPTEIWKAWLGFSPRLPRVSKAV